MSSDVSPKLVHPSLHGRTALSLTSRCHLLPSSVASVSLNSSCSNNSMHVAGPSSLNLPRFTNKWRMV